MELQKEFCIRSHHIPNRIVVPAMADFGMTDDDGLINEHHLERYGAYQNAGVVIIEACAVSKMPELRKTIGIYSDECIPGLSKLANVTKQNGGLALVQIMETGLCTMKENCVAEISKEKILEYREDFIEAAKRCQKAGFDGVEIHAAHGMFIDEIIETSERTDEYGRNLPNRLRFLTEIIEGVRDACGVEFVIAVRFGNSDYRELIQEALSIQEAGADLLDVSTGMSSYKDVPTDFTYDSKIYAAMLVKKAVSVPVICVGNITDWQQAEEILQLGYADFTAIGRGFLCDPLWAKKALSKELPKKCIHCKNCSWYIDGRRCPIAIRTRSEMR